MTPANEMCPCGIGDYGEHCQVIHEGGAGLGVSAEALMRARYSAYVLHNRTFLLESWHPDTSPETIEFDPEIEWHGLEIIATEGGTGLDRRGRVEFKARFERNHEPLELHERSTFERLDGRWVYVDGD